MTTMRAKLRIASVFRQPNAEVISFHAVPAESYPADGSDEDNTYAKFSPSVDLKITIMNPEMLGKFNPGDKFNVDFTPVKQ